MSIFHIRSISRRVARGEDGFTLIELLTAAVVLAIGISALTTVLISSRQLVNDSERRAAANHVAEEALEDVLARPYGQVALAALPTPSSDPFDPDYYVSGATYRPNQSGGGSTGYEALVSGGTVASSSPWSDGRLSGRVHRYV